MKIKAEPRKLPDAFPMDWEPTATAPFDRDLELAVIDASGIHLLVFPCRRVLRGWINAATKQPVAVRPTHWRAWDDAVSPLFARSDS